jgi:hypothetical protein
MTLCSGPDSRLRDCLGLSREEPDDADTPRSLPIPRAKQSRRLKHRRGYLLTTRNTEEADAAGAQACLREPDAPCILVRPAHQRAEKECVSSSNVGHATAEVSLHDHRAGIGSITPSRTILTDNVRSVSTPPLTRRCHPSACGGLFFDPLRRMVGGGGTPRARVAAGSRASTREQAAEMPCETRRGVAPIDRP